MHTIKLKAVIDERQQLHLQLPPDTPTGEAEVTVRVALASAAANTTPADNPTPMASLREFFAALDARPLSHPRSGEDIEAQIAEERASWD